MPLDQRLVWTCVLADCVIDLLVSRRGSIFVLCSSFLSWFISALATPSSLCPFLALHSLRFWFLFFCRSCSLVLIAVSQAFQHLLVPCITFLHFTSRLLVMLNFFASSLSPFAFIYVLASVAAVCSSFLTFKFQFIFGCSACFWCVQLSSLFPACE